MDQAMTPEQQQQVQQLTVYAAQRKEQAAGILNIGMLCFEKCISGDKFSATFDKKTENCFKNCAERFIDTQYFVANRLQEKMQQ